MTRGGRSTLVGQEFTMNRYRYAFVAALVLSAATLAAQQGGRGGAQAPQVGFARGHRRSPHQLPHRCAAGARDPAECERHPGLGQNTRLTKADNGVWELTVGPLDSGAYRYNFNVDGVATIDPRNPAISESNNNIWSLVYVPGSAICSTRRPCRTAPSRRSPTSPRRSGATAACTSTRRLATRTAPRPLPGVLSPARRWRQRRLVVNGRTLGLHPRQPDRRRARRSR